MLILSSNVQKITTSKNTNTKEYIMNLFTKWFKKKQSSPTLDSHISSLVDNYQKEYNTHDISYNMGETREKAEMLK